VKGKKNQGSREKKEIVESQKKQHGWCGEGDKGVVHGQGGEVVKLGFGPGVGKPGVFPPKKNLERKKKNRPEKKEEQMAWARPGTHFAGLGETPRFVRWKFSLLKGVREKGKFR